jgi:hypothetical protein
VSTGLPEPALYWQTEDPRLNATYYLAYASTAVHDYSQEELLELLALSRQRNAEAGITGLLLYAPGTDGAMGTFVQVLEGFRPAVQALYVRILRDPRHQHCTVFQEGEVFQRRFADWSMGFRNLSTLRPSEIEGFNPMFFQNWTLQKVLAEPDPVLRLLYSFAGD